MDWCTKNTSELDLMASRFDICFEERDGTLKNTSRSAICKISESLEEI